METFKEKNLYLIKFLELESIPFMRNLRLSEFTYFKTGGVLSLLIQPTNILQLQSVISFMASSRLSYKVIGETSNLMFLDDVDYSCCITTRKLTHIHYSKEHGTLIAECGAMLPELARFALYKLIEGFSGLEGIPGTIGGAVFMNAGAYDCSIDEVLSKVEVLNPDGSIEELPVEQLGLKYRNSIFKMREHPGIIARAHFKVRYGNQQSIYQNMELFHAKRHKYQEFMYPNLGSLYSGSIYRSLGEKDFFYRIVSALYLLFNYKFKCFRRESPINRKWINDFTVKRFNIQFKNQPFSDKTMNCLINNGHHTDDHLHFINQIEKLTGAKIPIENEIVEPF